ncbi:MAG TPA: cell division protein, partial [Caulobacteraceae bacterium]
MIQALFARRWRSFRVIDIVALGVLVALILILYLAKTFAGDERSQIARVEHQISEEKARVRVLRAEVAYLEKP